MKLLHYSQEKFELSPIEYDQEKHHWHAKPVGLWFSVEGQYDWKWWCLAEEFRLDCLAHSYEIILKHESKILLIQTEKELFDFTKQYSIKTVDRHVGENEDTHQLDWYEIKKKHQGIIITPYQWECRINFRSSWYYGWDCASGCIWDLTCIEKFEYLGYHKIKKETQE